MRLRDKVIFRKRAVIETVNDQLKNVSQIKHTRHKSAGNFLINLLAAIAAYTHQPKKPSINLAEQSYVADGCIKNPKLRLSKI